MTPPTATPTATATPPRQALRFDVLIVAGLSAALPLNATQRVIIITKPVSFKGASGWDELRRFMRDYVSIVRTNKRLEHAAHRVALLQAEIQEFYGHFQVTRGLLELRNLVQVADLIIQSARTRHGSRGLHYSQDDPHTLAQASNTVLTPPPPPNPETP